MAANPDLKEVAPTHPALVYDADRPGIKDAQTDVSLWNAKKGVLAGVIENVMRKHGAEAVISAKPEDELEIPGATGAKLTIIEARRAQPPMTADEASEIGTEICDRWHEVSRGVLPPFCDTVHFLPAEMVRAA